MLEAHRLPIYLFAYGCITTQTGRGIIQVVPDTQSRDAIAKASTRAGNLHQYFLMKYGGEGSDSYKRAQDNFICSSAGYAVISYILQFKDRHNGNILIDGQGHTIHIDFGFIVDNSPGPGHRGLQFETVSVC